MTKSYYGQTDADYTPNDIGPIETAHYKDHELLSDEEIYDERDVDAPW